MRRNRNPTSLTPRRQRAKLRMSREHARLEKDDGYVPYVPYVPYVRQSQGMSRDTSYVPRED